MGTYEQVHAAVFTGCLRAGIAKCRAFLADFGADDEGAEQGEKFCAVVQAAEIIAGGIECGAVPLALGDDAALVAQRWVSGFLSHGERVAAPSENKLSEPQRDAAFEAHQHHARDWFTRATYCNPRSNDARAKYAATRFADALWTHEVEIEDDDGATKWVPCVVLRRRPYLSGGELAYDVRTWGREWRMCAPECVREARS